ncbi:Gfo/Idh/MocA family protein, partial [Acidovorax soli]|uniref:Gfo/Idh/MocA family protein n=1 Tax=Acidovorax soli TaxID=592050 RepID=UPI0032B13C3C
MKKVTWGVLSTAKIGMEKVTPALMRSQWCDVQAIASRSLPSARAAADKLGIPKAYGSYEELLADPAIEAIYNPLPNHLHVPLTLQAAAAGKHVLCEKPVALSAAQAESLRAASRRVHIEEAFMVRHHPQWQRARELVRAGRIGTPQAVQVFFSYFNDDPGNIRNQPGIGGGALFDIGCYAVLAGRYLFECEPLR